MTEAQGTPSPQNAPEQPSSSPLELRIQELEAQLKEKESKYVYLYAEFENFKKRVVKERSDLMKFGWENQARDLILGIDNLERAVAHVSPETDKNLVEGLKMVLGQFRTAMQRYGVETIDTSNHKPFDPNLHEAVAQENSDAPTGSIVGEQLRGYTLHGRLLRPARVTVSQGPQSQA